MDFAQLKSLLTSAGVNLLLGILILVVGIFLVHWFIKFMCKTKLFQKLDTQLQSFFKNLINIILIIIVILTAVNVIGIPLTSMITIFASAGVAISLGMQGALGNLVGGVTLLILKPIRAGEFVKVGEYTGVVRAIGAFYTEIQPLDNSLISIPNSSLTNTSMVNYTRLGMQRIEAQFTVALGEDIDKVRAVLLDMARKGERVLEEPSPWVLITKTTDTGMVMAVRAWAKPEDWGNVYYYLLEEGKKALDEAGIKIPYQQMDVHLKQD